jgi:hypothetical protein
VPPPLAAASLAAGPRGVPPPYIMYPSWSNTFIPLYSNPFSTSDNCYILLLYKVGMSLFKITTTITTKPFSPKQVGVG